MSAPRQEQQLILDEITQLEEQLQNAKLRLSNPTEVVEQSDCGRHIDNERVDISDGMLTLHPLLLLSDSALPLGSFAFSSGLESFLAHRRLSLGPSRVAGDFEHFLRLSLQSLASSALPFVLAAHRHPESLLELDNDFDAGTPCTVARRASVAQGRALLAVWERSLKGEFDVMTPLSDFAAGFREGMASDDLYTPNAHLAPLWGVVTRTLGLPLASSAYVFLFSHMRAVVSAAVRANVLGPYQAQMVLASGGMRRQIDELVRHHWNTPPEEAGQTVPAADLWIGRHEKLYSRIFNS